ncbi:alpha/beta fold hydrolase [Clostridium sp.]|uniref:alpha/beta fold hydrolase n=1 Tax=Clostridium sp. TaxID=1506 RepID=UPI0034645313
MKGLFLYGANCTSQVWNKIKRFFSDFDITYVEYSHDVTQNAQCVEDITRWVADKYKDKQFDFIVGHSMGGIIGLELIANYEYKFDKVIFIESNLRPANLFYRNLMTNENMNLYGENILKMISNEAPFYNDNLKKSLQEEFDYTEYIKSISSNIYGIYGDRGISNYAKRIEDLCLDKSISQKIKFIFIESSCHMPMIENPQKLAKVILDIIG